MLVRLGKEIRRAHVEEETRIERQQVSKTRVGDIQEHPDGRADQGCHRVGDEPAERLPAILRLAEEVLIDGS